MAQTDLLMCRVILIPPQCAETRSSIVVPTNRGTIDSANKDVLRNDKSCCCDFMSALHSTDGKVNFVKFVWACSMGSFVIVFRPS